MDLYSVASTGTLAFSGSSAKRNSFFTIIGESVTVECSTSSTDILAADVVVSALDCHVNVEASDVT